MNFISSRNLSTITRQIYNAIAFPKPYSTASLYGYATVPLCFKIFGKDHNRFGNIIILHGALGSKKDWLDVGENIAQRARRQVFVVDLRNHGESSHHESNTYMDMAADLSVFMPNMGISEASFIGHDIGGSAAMILALLEPEKVEKLIAVDISPVSLAVPFSALYPKIVDVMWAVNFDPTETNVAVARNTAKKKLSALEMLRDVDAMSFILNNINFTSNRTIGWTCNLDCIQKSFPIWSSFPSHLVGDKVYNGPTMFIAGEKSNFLPPSDFTGIRDYFPKALVKYFSDVGHNIHIEKPDEFVATVVRFTERNEVY